MKGLATVGKLSRLLLSRQQVNRILFKPCNQWTLTQHRHGSMESLVKLSKRRAAQHGWSQTSFNGQCLDFGIRRWIYTKTIFFPELYAPVDPSWIVRCLIHNWHLESYGMFKHEIHFSESDILTDVHLLSFLWLSLLRSTIAAENVKYDPSCRLAERHNGMFSCKGA